MCKINTVELVQDERKRGVATQNSNTVIATSYINIIQMSLMTHLSHVRCVKIT